MSDYARIHDFSVKDALTTGDPAKLIKGSEVDAEFDELVIHNSSKVDKPPGASEGDFLRFTSGVWLPSSAGTVPAGSLMPFAGTTLPTDWLWCDGSQVSTTTYTALFAAIGYTYGGSGANFSLPDLRGRAAFGKDNMDNAVGVGGGDAARLTSGGAPGINGDTLGASGGVEEHQLTEAELAAHAHGIGGNSTVGVSASNYRLSPSSSSVGDTKSAGGDAAHTNMPPAIVLNYIIFLGA